ncbi:g2472 [Coccomyxa elongata]
MLQIQTRRAPGIELHKAVLFPDFRSAHRRCVRRRDIGGRSTTERREGTTTSGGESSEHVIVRSLPAVRQPAPPPEPVPVQHSPAYLLRHRSRPEPGESSLIRAKQQEPFTGNAVEWAVRRLDASLDEAELDPPPGAKAVIDVARGPVGSATVQGVTAAARVTVQVGTTALKAAAPVGKWVVQQGFKAALGVLTSDNSKSRQRK